MSDCEREMNCKRPSNSQFDLQLRRAGGDPTRMTYRWDEEDGEVFNPDHRARSAPNSLVVRNLVGQWPVSVCLSIFVCLSRCFDIPLSVIQCFSLSISLSLSFLLSFFLSVLLSFFLSFFLSLIYQTIEATIGLTEEKRRSIDKEEYDKRYRDNM